MNEYFKIDVFSNSAQPPHLTILFYQKSEQSADTEMEKIYYTHNLKASLYYVSNDQFLLHVEFGHSFYRVQ